MNDTALNVDYEAVRFSVPQQTVVGRAGNCTVSQKTMQPTSCHNFIKYEPTVEIFSQACLSGNLQ